MNLPLAALGLLVCTTMPLQAAGLHKWVDASGEVIYSDTPPETSRSPDADASDSVPDRLYARRDGREYCGAEELSGPADTPDDLLDRSGRHLPGWQSELASLKQQRVDAVRDKTLARPEGKAGADARLRQIIQQIGVTECKIRWAQRKQTELQGLREHIAREYQRRRSEVAELVAKIRASCGDQPTTPAERQRFLEKWLHCVNGFRMKLVDAMQALRAAEQRYNNVR